MVSRQADKREAVISRTIFWVLLLIFVATATTILFLLFAPFDLTREDIDVADVAQLVNDNYGDAEANTIEGPKQIDFQPVVDAWVDSVGGNKSVLVYDLDRDEMVGAYNPDTEYAIASLYKLFVVYEGYRRVQVGEWGLDDTVGSTGYTMSECLNLAISRSHSPCAESLLRMIGYDHINEIVSNDFGIKNSNIKDLISNPKDILEIMKIFYKHREITDEDLIAKIKDSFLNQPVTEYNWRQGLPSGFSKANVYNKVGWDYNSDDEYWNIYHDAAIVEFPEENRHFVVVVMTNHVPFEQIKRFGRLIEERYYGDD